MESGPITGWIQKHHGFPKHRQILFQLRNLFFDGLSYVRQVAD